MRKKNWAGSVLQGGVLHQQTRFVSSLSANDNLSQADWTVQRRTQSLTFKDKLFLFASKLSEKLKSDMKLYPYTGYWQVFRSRCYSHLARPT